MNDSYEALENRLLEVTRELLNSRSEVKALRRALKSHGEILELNARLVLENQELRINQELSQEL